MTHAIAAIVLVLAIGIGLEYRQKVTAWRRRLRRRLNARF